MQKGGQDLTGRGYETGHVANVLSDLESSFADYFRTFRSGDMPLKQRFADALKSFKGEQKHYLDLFHLDALEDYGYDPSAFKADLNRRCPIIRRCLMSPAKVMDAYRRNFYTAGGARLLEVTENIVRYAHRHIIDFDNDAHESAASVDELRLGDIDDEEYTAYGVIGGGIRSRFLYMLYPRAFPNRSQNSIWALYFLSNRKDYGFRDGSEFLMVEPERAQQNYFYPYDLFAYYALKQLNQLRAACDTEVGELDSHYRYVYLDAFFDHVADTNRDAIQCLLGVDEYGHDISY